MDDEFALSPVIPDGFADGLAEFLKDDFGIDEWHKARLAYALCVELALWHVDEAHLRSTVEAISAVEYLNRVASYFVEASGAYWLEDIAEKACQASMNWIQERATVRVWDYINQTIFGITGRYRADQGEWPNVARPPDSGGRFEEAQALIARMNEDASSEDFFDILKINRIIDLRFPNHTTFDSPEALIVGVSAAIECIEYVEAGDDLQDRAAVEENLPKALVLIDPTAEAIELRRILGRLDLVGLHTACLGFKAMAEKNAAYWGFDLEGQVELPPPN